MPTQNPAVIEAAPIPAAPAAPAYRYHSLVARSSAWCAAHRWRTLAAALLVLAGAVVLLAGGMQTTEDDDQLVGDSAVAVRIVDGGGLRHPADRECRDLHPFGPPGPGPGPADLRRAARRVPGTGRCGLGRAARTVPDAATMMLPVQLDVLPGHPAGAPTAGDAVGPMMAATQRVAAAHPDLQIGQVGDGSIDAEVGRQLDSDFRRAEMISLPVSLAVLLIAFGAVVAAGVPVVLGIFSVVVALGLTAFASGRSPRSTRTRRASCC
jgi:RND superfamily putative drug exporter